MRRGFGWQGFGPGFAGFGFGRGRRRNWFGAGDMKYVILKLLKDKPRHGYEVMKELEGKKVYEITDQGLKFLDEHKDLVEDIFDRVKDAVDEVLGGGMGELNRAIGALMRSAYRTGWRSKDDAVRQKLSDILKRAAQEIDALVQS